MRQKLLILLCILFCINKILSQTNWELLNPKPSSYIGKDIEFVTNNIGYIINHRELLETIDSGNTWTKKQTISSGNDMAFYNTTGYIVGNNGYVLKSEDNGASWTQIDTGFTDSFNTVNIIDLENIILSSSDIYGSHDIIKTNDGGLTWEKLNIFNLEDNFYVVDWQVVKTFFTSALVGHAICAQGTILKTIDGGQNWYETLTTNITPSDFFTIYFINENVGFASREHDNWFKTIDGGETWVTIQGVGWPIYDFNFLDENNGFAVGYSGKIYKTNDGGNSWTSLGSNGSDLYGVYFQDSNIGFATGDHGFIVKTTDGGSTWAQYSPTYANVKGLQFIDANVGYARTGSVLFKTSDAGNTWFLVNSSNTNSLSAHAFKFINENVGFSTGGYGGSALYKTIDGGVTWSILNNGNNIISDGINTICFLNENIGFVSGGFNQTRTMKTIDGGLNWTQVSDQAFGQIQFVNDMVGYASRLDHYYNGAIYKTTDGGTTWSISIEVQDKDIYAFHFVDENNGYFVGYQGLLYKTNDGGATWQKLTVPHSYEDYNVVKFYSKNVGYIAEDGMLYRTVNGGESWLYLSGAFTTNSIEIVGDNIFIASTNGKIYRSDIEYDLVALYANSAENISNTSIKLTGNVTSNDAAVSDVKFEYSIDYAFNNIVSTTPNSVASGESVNVSIDITGLHPNTKYYYRLKASSNSINYTSTISNFTTFNDYEITTNPTYTYTSTTAEISGSVISNKNDITNIEFEYGISADALDNTIVGTPALVSANTTENIAASLNNLEPETQYFFRLKATHQGEVIYGDVQSLQRKKNIILVYVTQSLMGMR